jgi:hypothetical protein
MFFSSFSFLGRVASNRFGLGVSCLFRYLFRPLLRRRRESKNLRLDRSFVFGLSSISSFDVFSVFVSTIQSHQASASTHREKRHRISPSSSSSPKRRMKRKKTRNPSRRTARRRTARRKTSSTRRSGSGTFGTGKKDCHLVTAGIATADVAGIAGDAAGVAALTYLPSMFRHKPLARLGVVRQICQQDLAVFQTPGLG